jgi:hypothetical protein
MEIPVPPPPVSAYSLIVGAWLFAGVVPLLYVAKSGWRKTLRYSSWCLVGTAPLVLPYIYAVRANSVEVVHGRIHVQAGLLYKAVRSVDDFKLDEAVAAPLRDIPQARLSARLTGIGASGYSAGNFSMTKGGQAFVLITDPDKTLFLPSKAGASLLVSVNDPQGLLEVLRSQVAR